MNPLRFIIYFVSDLVLSYVFVLFFTFAAVTIGLASLALVGLLFTILFTLLFGWLYFRTVPDMSWRHRGEAILVWVGLVVLTDIIVLKLFYGGSISNMGSLELTGYALQGLTLFVAAYLAGHEHPRLASSPDLLIHEE